MPLGLGGCFGVRRSRASSIDGEEYGRQRYASAAARRALPAPPTAPRPLSSFGNFESLSGRGSSSSRAAGPAVAAPPATLPARPDESSRKTKKKQHKKQMKLKNKRQQQEKKRLSASPSGSGINPDTSKKAKKGRARFLFFGRRRDRGCANPSGKGTAKKAKKGRARFLFFGRRRDTRPPGMLLHIRGVATAWPADNLIKERAHSDAALLSPFLPEDEPSVALSFKKKKSIDCAAADEHCGPGALASGSSSGTQNGGTLPPESAARFAAALALGDKKGGKAAAAAGVKGRNASTADPAQTTPPSRSRPGILHLDHGYSVCSNDQDGEVTPYAVPVPMSPSMHEYAEVADAYPVVVSPHVYAIMSRPEAPWAAALQDPNNPATPPTLDELSSVQRRRTSTYDSAAGCVVGGSGRHRTSTYDSAAGDAIEAAAKTASADSHEYAVIADLTLAAAPAPAPMSAKLPSTHDYAEIAELIPPRGLVRGAVYIGGSAPGAVATAAAAAAAEHAAAAAAAEPSIDYRAASSSTSTNDDYAVVDESIASAAAFATAAIGIVDLSAPAYTFRSAGDDSTLTAANAHTFAFPVAPTHSTESSTTVVPTTPIEIPSFQPQNSPPLSPHIEKGFYSSFGDQSSEKRKPQRSASPAPRLGVLSRAVADALNEHTEQHQDMVASKTYVVTAVDAGAGAETAPPTTSNAELLMTTPWKEVRTDSQQETLKRRT